MPVHKIDQFIHSFMFKKRIREEKIHSAILHTLRYYYSYQLDQYLTYFNDKVRHVPNIMNIELPTLLVKLNHKHPD